MGVVKVKFYNFIKTPNSTKRVTEDMESVELNCKFKQATSIVDPVLIVNSSDIYKYNYCYIEEFGRYYFVSNHISYPNNIWEVSCSVDVMATYRDDIMNTKAFIQYASTGYNYLLPDSRLPREVNPGTGYYEKILDSFDEKGTYILTTISNENPNSNSGFATSYAIPANLMGDLVRVVNSTDFYTQLKEQFDEPLSAIISCIWIPCKLESIASSATEIVIGGYATGVHSWFAKDKAKFYTSIQIGDSYIWQENDSWNYLNAEPYTETHLYLPGVGITQIPLFKIAPYSHIVIEYCIDFLTGDITYRIGGSGFPVITAKGNLAVEMPIGRMTYDPTSVLKNAGTAIASTVGLVASGLSGNVPGAILSASSILGSTANMITATQTTTSVGGLLGGRSSAPFNTKIELTMDYYRPSDNPQNIASTIGRPVMRVERIGNFSGFVKCVCAFIESSATETEQNKMSQIVNSGAYTPWGGIIIE